MRFTDYQREAKKTAIYPAVSRFEYLALGLIGETGEIAEKMKKWIRDGKLDVDLLSKEIGDVMWYVANVCEDTMTDLSDAIFRKYQAISGSNLTGVVKEEMHAISKDSAPKFVLTLLESSSSIANKLMFGNTRIPYFMISEIVINLAIFANCFDLDLGKIMEDNIAKLKSRKDRDVISGSGDKR